MNKALLTGFIISALLGCGVEDPVEFSNTHGLCGDDSGVEEDVGFEVDASADAGTITVCLAGQADSIRNSLIGVGNSQMAGKPDAMTLTPVASNVEAIGSMLVPLVNTATERPIVTIANDISLAEASEDDQVVIYGSVSGAQVPDIAQSTTLYNQVLSKASQAQGLLPMGEDLAIYAAATLINTVEAESAIIRSFQRGCCCRRRASRSRLPAH